MLKNPLLLLVSLFFYGWGEPVYLFLMIAAYTLHIYFDFSGHSDMARGLGRVFGFAFLKKFNYPYISRSVTEFWRRWHISLSTWFQEYVYIPLGGNCRGKGRQILNLLIVWPLTGLWHGASWNFVLWSLYYALLLMAEKLFLLPILKKAPGVLSHFYTIVIFMLGWALFYFEDMAALGAFLGRLSLPQGNYRIETISGFRGSTYTRSALWLTPGEDLELWHSDAPITVTHEERTESQAGIFFRDRLEEADKYTVYLDGNHALVRMKNPDAPDGGKLLVIRDSYTNCLGGFLADSWENVVLADLRYYRQPLSELMAEEEFDRVLICYSIGNFLTDTNLAWLR